jgi:hypothetical protein
MAIRICKPKVEEAVRRPNYKVNDVGRTWCQNNPGKLWLVICNNATHRDNSMLYNTKRFARDGFRFEPHDIDEDAYWMSWHEPLGY